MKTFRIPLLSTLAGLALLLFTPHAQAIDCPAGAACTDPVGFITLTANPSDDGVNKKITLLGLGLFNAVEFQGPVDSVSGSTLGIIGIQASQFDGMYFVQIASGANSGIMADIASTAADSITLAQDISSLIAVDDIIKIRKHSTIESVFGVNNALGLTGGTTAGASDTINLFNADGTVSVIFWVPGSDVWFNGIAIVNDFIIYPDQGIFMQRIGTDTASGKLLGSVKTDVTALTIENGFNVLANVYPVDVTLANSGLNTNDGGVTGLLAGTSLTQADVVRIFDDAGALKSYYLVDEQNNIWFDGIALSGDVVLKSGSSFIITRRNDGINWFQDPTF